MRDRLIELVCEATQEDNCVAHCNYPPCNKCKSIADHLLANGVIVPPCKVGDTLWYLDYGLPKCFIVPEKVIVQDIVLLNNTMFIRCDKLTSFQPSDFGKTVYLTREEAEAKLKGGEG